MIKLDLLLVRLDIVEPYCLENGVSTEQGDADCGQARWSRRGLVRTLTLRGSIVTGLEKPEGPQSRHGGKHYRQTG